MSRESLQRESFRKRPAHIVEGIDLENDSMFPHLPMNVFVDDHLDGSSKPLNGHRSLQKDRGNIALLMVLYVLQGVPLGLSGSIPMLLQSKNINYKDQAMFSFVHWPFSIKLLWAPIVDSVYLPWFGRRKSWLVPTQYMIGLFMLIVSYHVDDLIGSDGKPVNILLLTALFFSLNVLAASQDIAVDGWALTMLSKQNVGWASTCNSVGQTAGYFLGNVLFLALESPEFCNTYLRAQPQFYGVVTFSSFFYFWSIVFFITTSLVWALKTEKEDPSVDAETGIAGTYKLLFSVLRLPAVRSLIVIYLTCKIGFAATDGLSGLKLIEAGMPRERLAIFAIPMIPIQILLPLIISKYTAGAEPLNLFIKAMPFRVLMSVPYVMIVHVARLIQVKPGEFPHYYYVLILLSYALHQVVVYCMFVSLMAFNAKVSDPAIGGTYMTLLNTLSNLGGNWPVTVALSLVESVTWKKCLGGPGFCANSEEVKVCQSAKGVCTTLLDGYYVECLVCFIFGILWYFWKRNKLKEVQRLHPKSWKCEIS